MEEQLVHQKIKERIDLMLKDPALMEVYQQKPTQEDAENWIFAQALITLIYTPEEREKLAKKNPVIKEQNIKKGDIVEVIVSFNSRYNYKGAIGVITDLDEDDEDLPYWVEFRNNLPPNWMGKRHLKKVI